MKILKDKFKNKKYLLIFLMSILIISIALIIFNNWKINKNRYNIKIKEKHQKINNLKQDKNTNKENKKQSQKENQKNKEIKIFSIKIWSYIINFLDFKDLDKFILLSNKEQTVFDVNKINHILNNKEEKFIDLIKNNNWYKWNIVYKNDIKISFLKKDGNINFKIKTTNLNNWWDCNVNLENKQVDCYNSKKKIKCKIDQKNNINCKIYKKIWNIYLLTKDKIYGTVTTGIKKY